MEEQTAGFTDRIQAAVDAHSVQLLATSAVDLQDLEARSDVPDVQEGDVAELAAPLHGDADAAEESAEHIAQILAEVETLVGVGPHAVHGVSALWFRQNIFEIDLWSHIAEQNQQRREEDGEEKEKEGGGGEGGGGEEEEVKEEEEEQIS